MHSKDRIVKKSSANEGNIDISADIQKRQRDTATFPLNKEPCRKQKQ
jgi:hypothetical protein